ncbi:MAG: hypothetical protein QOJ58_4344, partial [Alphaproteobacteria bacterium]|nr:hypothetical protein [Alphaproteobacteria bacterium]
QLDHAFIDFLDLHSVRELLQNIRMLIEIRAQLGHAIRPQAFEQLDQLARVDLPKSDRHGLKQMPIPLLAIAQRFFRPLSLGDVIIGFQDSDWPSTLVMPQGPPARHSDLRSVSLRMDELPLPAASADQLRRDLFKSRWKNRPLELVRDMAERLLLVPTVQLLGAAVPERYHIIHPAYEDRVVREVEELSPLT